MTVFQTTGEIGVNVLVFVFDDRVVDSGESHGAQSFKVWNLDVVNIAIDKHAITRERQSESEQLLLFSYERL